VNKSGIFVLYDRKSISNGPIQAIAMSIPTDKAEFIGVPAFDPLTGYVYVGLPTSEGIYQPGMAAFAMAANCTLNPTPVWSQAFGPAGTSGADVRRSPISIANGVVYISNFTGDTEYAFDASTGAQLWTTPLSDWGNVGTVIANGIAYVSAVDGSITAWAPPASAARLRKHVAAANRPPATISRSRAARYLATFRSNDW
jgi:outer membrane protein assembly factor BamB